MNARDRLRELYRQRAFQFGDFTLASGKKSSYYINSKKVLFHSEALHLLGELLFETTKDLNAQAIGGLEVGAIPMAAVAGMYYHQQGRSIEGFFVRKQAKDHGSQQRVEGEVYSGNGVIVIDDVLTTGESVMQAIQEVEKLGASVLRVICVVDRLQGARERLKDYDFQPLYTVRDFGIDPLPS